MNIKNLTTKEVLHLLNSKTMEEWNEYLPLLFEDERRSIQKIGKDLQKKLEKKENEIKRIQKLWEYENKLFLKGYRFIAGIDEAGRGPLAGPVVAAAVILPPNHHLDDVDDSKKLSPQKRETLCDLIYDEALAVGVGIVDHTIIDRVNIFNATKLAMVDAVKNLSLLPDFLLIDAVQLTDIDIKQQSIIKGDSLSISIAAASIIAKVTRDRIMDQYHEQFPAYNFAAHKGYGTKEHCETIRRIGATPIHRKTFIKNFTGDENEDNTITNKNSF
ncbi:MAG: ribonuclease HII [Bacillota bacterium]